MNGLSLEELSERTRIGRHQLAAVLNEELHLGRVAVEEDGTWHLTPEADATVGRFFRGLWSPPEEDL